MLRYKEIKNQLLEMLPDMNPGQRLPSRPVLCKALDTTRTTLDKAIRELEEEGLLVSRKGSGTCVVGMIEGATPTVENWCVIIPSVMEDIYPGLVRGIENVAQRKNINVILCNSDNDTEKQEKYIKRLMVSGVAGFIIVPVILHSIEENARLYGSLCKSNIPFVFCNRGVEGICAPVVTSNDFYGGYIATKHLIEKGYRHIAYIAKTKCRTSMDRCQGYISALLENGMEINRRLIVMPTEISGDVSAYAAAARLLASGEEIDAVFCFNDYVALDVCRAIREAGLRVSGDVGIIGYDDITACGSCLPALTSVCYKNIEIGEKAAELLWDMSHNLPPNSNFEYYLYQPSIVDRCSCLGPEADPPCSKQDENGVL